MSSYRHGVIIKTEDAVQDVRAWLEKNCLGKWYLELQDMSEDLLTKTLKLGFEDDMDRQRFKSAFARRRSPAA